jgi:signal transduction histidine kinase
MEGEPRDTPADSGEVRHWFRQPPAQALFAAVLLAAILLPYWWLAVQWSRHLLLLPDEQFTFAATTYLCVLIVADSAFLVRYYQLRRKRELVEKTEELRRSEDTLRLTVKKLNLLSSITRHDVLNQLSALSSFVELVRESVADPTVQEYLEKEKAGISNIQRQIEFTRDYENLGIKSPSWQNVQKVLFHAAGDVRLGSVTLATDLGDLEIYADPLLEKVFFNLLENAIHHGQKVTRIGCSRHTSGDRMVLVVEDDGIGIPEEEKENIFTRRFFRNTGYGLLLSKEILSITGITIMENGVPGRGARFEIGIPRGRYRIR